MDFFKQIIEMSPRPNLTIEIEGGEDGQLSVSVLQDKKHLESERDKLRKELMVRNGASQN